jgi:hypothetical protein
MKEEKGRRWWVLAVEIIITLGRRNLADPRPAYCFYIHVVLTNHA